MLKKEDKRLYKELVDRIIQLGEVKDEFIVLDISKGYLFYYPETKMIARQYGENSPYMVVFKYCEDELSIIAKELTSKIEELLKETYKTDIV